MVSIQPMVHRKWLFLLTVMLLLFLPMRVGAEVPEAEELFQKLLESFQTVDFEGKLTLISPIPGGDTMCEALVIRKAPDKQRIEFTWPPEIRGTGMALNGKGRWHIRDRRDRERRLSPPPPRAMDEFLLLKNVQLLLQNYDVQVLDGGHVAGRSTYLLEIRPKATGRPSRKVWIDAEMGVILKMEHYNSQKRLEQLFAYSEINFKPEIDEADFRSPQEIQDRERPPKERGREELWNYNQGEPDVERIRKEAQLDIIFPDQAPAGFILQSIDVLKFGKLKNVHLKYTDGLAVLSVFQSSSDRRGPGRIPEGRPGAGRGDKPPWRGSSAEKISIDGIECEVISRGPMFIFRWNYRGIYFTLMGELGREEMAEIASSFVRKEG